MNAGVQFRPLILVLSCAALAADCGNDELAPNPNAGGSAGAPVNDAASEVPPACGGMGEMCCANDTCSEGLGCTGSTADKSDYRCFPCGGRDERCCIAAPSCGEGLYCGRFIDSPPFGAWCLPQPDAGGTHCIITCVQAGGQYCGLINSRCGTTLLCGACTKPGLTCGGAGIPSVCGAPSDGGGCTPTECQAPSGKYCGVVGDGCGSTMDCGACDEGVECGFDHVCFKGIDAGRPREPPPPLPPPSPPPLPPNLSSG